MPLYNITLKAGAPVEALDEARETAKEKGGIIRHEYSIIKGFTVEFPDDTVQTFESTEHVHVEQDGAMNTQ
ncbi:Proteinase inhibitor propeptide [Penicillium mononematosum]|uniref:Proteinase inhibitor propeptide n=1 Tax=Penicillium mononematosum TaxID=268346 RepID=UPI002549523D|nr:Proteinase inhibitor propeptide [Penicillium mononematosum]KAJ6188243.1 Proteinase inhibitor propeptide [Penicillium mononematosum]